MGEPGGEDFTWREIGDRIRDWRLARGWSQHQLAQIAGISQSGVVHLEKGDTNPQLSTLREIAAAFGKSLRELISGVSSEVQTEATGLEGRIRRVLDSNDPGALAAFECGLKTAELLLERRSGGPLPNAYSSPLRSGTSETPSRSATPPARKAPSSKKADL